MCRSRLAVFVLTLSLLPLTNAVFAATYRVGSGGGCTHATVQSAIDAAAADPDVADFIRVTRTQSYDDIHLDIQDQNLVLQGGYADCSTDSEDNTRTILTGNGDDSVIRIHGDGDVVLRKLTLTGGRQPLFDYGYGGGIQVSGGPHLVSVDHLFVTGNAAGHGGGISIKNDINGDPNAVRLILGDDVVISFNDAQYPAGAYSGTQGGGIYCFESSIVWNGGGSSSINSNTASLDGGGIGVEQCDVTIAPHGSAGSFNGLVLNTAGRDGGGLLVGGASGGGTKFYVTDASRPVYVSGNSAGREGGGIKVNTNATVTAWDLILDGNRSYDEGGGVSVFAGGSTGDLGDSVFRMRGTLSGAPDGAVNCAADKHCNSISENIAKDGSDVLQQGAAVRVKANGGFGGNLRSLASIDHAVIKGNVGASIARIRVDCSSFGGSDATLDIDGTVIAENSVSGSVLLNPDAPFDCGGVLDLDADTIGGNSIGAAEVIASTDRVSLTDSIVWQPGRRALNAGALDVGQVEYLLANDLTGIPDSITNIAVDPRFMDPERGDFRLQASSPAVDYAPAETGVDADHRPRAVDLTLVPNDGFGTQDLGAYERQSIGNLVRNADFDEDLHIWTDVAPAATNWYDYDHAGAAGSGSLEVYDTTAASRAVGLSECVGIPGPGVYQLGGNGWSWEDLYPAIPDHAILRWTLRSSSADCSGSSIGSGESQAPTLGGWHAIAAQFVAVATDDWTPSTTVEVQLIQEKTANPFGGDSNAVLFDAITLVPGGDEIFADGFDP